MLVKIDNILYEVSNDHTVRGEFTPKKLQADWEAAKKTLTEEVIRRGHSRQSLFVTVSYKGYKFRKVEPSNQVELSSEVHNVQDS